MAYGGGQTNWFACRSAADYLFVRSLLMPRSCVSVYLDGRIRGASYRPEAKAEILHIAKEEHDCVVGVRGVDLCRLQVEFIAGRDEMEEFEATLGDSSEVFFGSFPGRDDDGERAITFIVPDPDGVTRGRLTETRTSTSRPWSRVTRTTAPA